MDYLNLFSIVLKEKKFMQITENSDVMLSTYDNPINPFTDFKAWWKMDLILGHDCCGLLARTANLSTFSSDQSKDLEIFNAMKEIVNENPTIYRIVSKEDYETEKEGRGV